MSIALLPLIVGVGLLVVTVCIIAFLFMRRDGDE